MIWPFSAVVLLTSGGMIIVAAILMICALFSYQLGSGEAEILSQRSINDGKWHKITAVRYDYILNPVVQVSVGALLNKILKDQHEGPYLFLYLFLYLQ